ncbi:MAG TPA: HNH endonuclease [Polyangiaceae bacterium]|nr:HNH endonuclease [Polyangiaceae bacterium]
MRIQLRLSECTVLLYREVARAFARQHPARRLLRSLCEHFLMVWNPVLTRQHKHKYDHIYQRDAYTCTSPVCERHDVTPHHLRFRSRGGGDEPENLTSLCVWCHLEGVHGGRIRAEPRANGIHWTIGRTAPMHVVDRDKAEPTEPPPLAEPG